MIMKGEHSKQLLVIGYWNLRFICNLVLGIWNFLIYGSGPAPTRVGPGQEGKPSLGQESIPVHALEGLMQEVVIIDSMKRKVLEDVLGDPFNLP